MIVELSFFNIYLHSTEEIDESTDDNSDVDGKFYFAVHIWMATVEQDILSN